MIQETHLCDIWELFGEITRNLSWIITLGYYTIIGKHPNIIKSQILFSACKFFKNIDMMQNPGENIAFTLNFNFPSCLLTNWRYQVVNFYLCIINCDKLLSPIENRTYSQFQWKKNASIFRGIEQHKII